jgi:hypothetical protein
MGVSFDKCCDSNDFTPASFRDFHRALFLFRRAPRDCFLRHLEWGTKFFAVYLFPMAHDGIRCSRCMTDWVRPIGRAYRDSEPTQLFECPACGKQVEFAVEPQVPSVRRAGGTMQPALAQPSPPLHQVGSLEAIRP